jgi:hypothetical protein
MARRKFFHHSALLVGMMTAGVLSIVPVKAGPFPFVGHHYSVDFQKFKVQLFFSSETSMTYVGVKSDGSLGAPETVQIKVEEARPNLFLVTWQEADKTTVVHLEDYDAQTIITNITNPDNSFEQYHGVFREIP